MNRLRNARVSALVLGDLMLDEYLWGKCGRISPEAPVPVVDIEKTTTVLGGAGNVINNLLAMSAKVFAAGVLGDDKSGIELKNMLESGGVNTDAIVIQNSRKTSRKTRVMASHQQIVRYDRESRDPIDENCENQLIEKLKSAIEKVDIVLISDYGKGVLTNSLTKCAIDIAKTANKKVLIDPKGSDYSKYKNATLITPNRKEASEAIGAALPTLESVKKAGEKLRSSLGLDYAIITLSEEGMMICGESADHIPTQAREVYDVTGAGDTALASLGFALAAGLGIAEAARFANNAAAVVVSKIGSATATIDETLAYEYRHSINQSGAKIVDLETIVREAERLKAADRKVVFTNGCFDILHRGHIEYLRQSRAEGDALIVGLNSDRSVRTVKGESRPIVCEEDRAFMLAALSFVDFVVLFDDPTPIELIKAIRPSVLTKGADYAGKQVVGSEYSGKLVLVDLVAGRSTTETIAKVLAKGSEK